MQMCLSQVCYFLHESIFNEFIIPVHSSIYHPSLNAVNEKKTVGRAGGSSQALSDQDGADQEGRNEFDALEGYVSITYSCICPHARTGLNQGVVSHKRSGAKHPYQHIYTKRRQMIAFFPLLLGCYNQSITSGAGLGTGGPALQSPLVRVLLDDVVVVDGH